MVCLLFYLDAEDINGCLKVSSTEQKSILSPAHNTEFINIVSHHVRCIKNYYSVYLQRELASTVTETRFQSASSSKHFNSSSNNGKFARANTYAQVHHEVEAPLTAFSDGAPKNFFGKALGKAALSFAFNFLKKCWRSASVEDRLMCSEMLSETLEIFQSLPVASLFHTEQSPAEVIQRSGCGESTEETALLEIAAKCATFLDSALSGLVLVHLCLQKNLSEHSFEYFSH